MKKNPVLAAMAVLALALTGCGSGGGGGADAQDPAGPEDKVVVKDAAERTVELDAVPERIVLGESRMAYSTVFLEKDNPVDHVVAWGTDLQKNAPDLYGKLTEKFPRAEDIPTIGSAQKGDLTAENLLEHDPDVFVMSLDQYQASQGNGFADQLEKTGIPYVVTDFRQQPLQNTEVSVRALGQLMGRDEQAEKFIDYYRQRVDAVTDTVENAMEEPTTFLWRAAGIKACCSTFANSNYGAMIDRAGGKNLGDGLLDGDEGDLTPEEILKDQPDLVVATGGTWADLKGDDDAKTSFVPLGYGTDENQPRKGLEQLRQQPGFDHLEAAENGRLHGIYHQFYDSPYNFIAMEVLAKWQQPDEFQDLDPEQDFKQFHEEFMPWELTGNFWVDQQ